MVDPKGSPENFKLLCATVFDDEAFSLAARSSKNEFIDTLSNICWAVWIVLCLAIVGVGWAVHKLASLMNVRPALVSGAYYCVVFACLFSV
jgi:hypothetical protein